MVKFISRIHEKVLFIAAFGFVLMSFFPPNGFSQIKWKARAVITDSSSIKLRNNLHCFGSNKYNNIDSSFFWIVNADCQPIENARIILSSDNGVFDTITEHSYEGLYFINAPSHGVYKLVVEAPGYETQMQHIQVYPQTRFKKRIALGKPGDYYSPSFFPLTNPSEYVSFTMNKPYKDAEELELLMFDFWKDYYKLKRIIDPTNTIKRHDNCLKWPSDSAKRSEFRKVIEESKVMETNTLQVFGDCSYKAGALVKFTNFLMDGTANENTIRSVIERNNFIIYKIGRNLHLNENRYYWNIDATYEAPLSRDLFIDIQKINLALPVVRTSVDYLIGAEHSK
jgi:hypothetical protein